MIQSKYIRKRLNKLYFHVEKYPYIQIPDVNTAVWNPTKLCELGFRIVETF